MSDFYKDLKLTKQAVGKVLTLDNDNKIISSDTNIADVADKEYVNTQNNALDARLTAVEEATGIITQKVIDINGEVVE